MAKTAFESRSYAFKAVDSVKDGVRTISKFNPEIIFIEENQPDIDASKLINLLSASKNTKNICVVVMSDGYDKDTRLNGLKSGVYDFMYKPYTGEEMKNLADSVRSFSDDVTDTKSGRVLVVEDSRIVCMVYEEIFTRLGYTFQIESDSTRAVDTIRAFRPDLILMDANMPDLDGFELTEMIRRDRELRSVRIIMVTSDTKKKSTVKALKLGVNDFLTKPFDEEVLIARMSTHLNGKRLYDDLLKAFGELNSLKDRLERLSITDGLTNLYNHRHFYDTLLDEMTKAKETGSPLSTLLFDIDHFKTFNDTHGHKAGDEVLRATAMVMSEALPEGAFLARYGGEEFGVLFPGLSLEEAFVEGDRLRHAVENAKVAFEGKIFSVTVSGGVGEWDGEIGDGPLIQMTDAALYKSKEAGRNQLTRALSG